MFIVSHIRKDGGVGKLNINGYGAENLAFQRFHELNASKYVLYCIVLERVDGDNSIPFSWDKRIETKFDEG